MNFRILGTLCLSIAGMLMFSSLPNPAQAAGEGGNTPGTPLTKPARGTVAFSARTVNPSNPVLVPGGSPVMVTLTGTGLEYVTDVQVLPEGNVFANVQGPWEKRSSTDLAVSLKAGSDASVGTYTLRLAAGEQKVDIPASVASVLVKTGPSIFPGRAGMEMERAPTATGTQDTTLGSQRTNQQLQMLSNVIKAQNDASQSVVRNMQGGSPSREAGGTEPEETGDSTGTAEVSGQTQDPASPRRIRPPGNAMVGNGSVIELTPREAPGNLGPRILEGPRDPASPEAFAYRFDKSTAGAVTSAVFDRAVKDVLSAARFHSNSCGGTWEVRRITIDIPNTYYNNDTPLSRLDYELTDKEKENSEWAQKTGGGMVPHRIKAIRACIDNWVGNAWTGRVEGGAFKIYLAHAADRKIKTRSKLEQKDLFWHDDADWNNVSTDEWIPDYNMGDTPLEIILTPAYDSGKLTYSGVDAMWTSLGGRWDGRDNRIEFAPYLTKITDYKAEKMEQIRQRAISLFNEASVRNRISQAITSEVLSNQFVSRIVALTGGSDGEVNYQYE